MRGFVGRVTDGLVDAIVPRVEARAAYCYWSSYCYCRYIDPGPTKYYKYCCSGMYCVCKRRHIVASCV